MKYSATSGYRAENTPFANPRTITACPNHCEGKGPCVAVCPVEVFQMGVLPKDRRPGLSVKGKIKGFVHGWKQVQAVQPDACRACGLCVRACPEKAITLARAKSA
ncbi:MAG: ferredoxin family protein [Pseudomonadota bacterium]